MKKFQIKKQKINNTNKQESILLSGKIEDIQKGDSFIVRFTEDHKAICKPSGKIRINKIKLVVGDIVRVELSPYDLYKGRIIFREK